MDNIRAFDNLEEYLSAGTITAMTFPTVAGIQNSGEIVYSDIADYPNDFIEQMEEKKSENGLASMVFWQYNMPYNP